MNLDTCDYLTAVSHKQFSLELYFFVGCRDELEYSRVYLKVIVESHKPMYY